MYDKELLELKKKLDKMLAPKTAEYKQGYKDGYAKAVDEFVERLKEKYGCLGYIDEITFEEVDDIAEQMKAGEENEID